MTKYGKNIPMIEARREAWISAEEASIGIGISQASYNDFEKGYRLPGQKNRKKISDYFRNLKNSLLKEDALPRKISKMPYLPPSKIIYLSNHSLYLEHTISMDEIEKSAMDKELEEAVREVLSSLTQKQEKVLRMRYGIGEDSEHTLEEAGNKLGVSGERIRQIETKALVRIIYSERINKLKPFLE